MRFIDEAKIRLAAGHGGKGAVSFRREKFIPRGGPDGGDGGRGGSIVIKASNQLSTLQDFRFRRVYQAERGHGGSGGNKTGRDGLDIELRIPVGTLLRDAETKEILMDFTDHEQTWIACKGGRGGKGNAHFVTATFQAPKFAQDGEEGEKREVILELKLLADVGIIGFPNGGKSTFISKISAARPKVADYAFTTRVPNLGVVEFSDFKSAVFADIPGLIENAHKGYGLGHKFLKHIERTRLFIHVLDGLTLLEKATQPDLEPEVAIQEAAEMVLEKYKIIRNELGLFEESLLHKPELVVINKGDLLNPEVAQAARKLIRQNIHHIRGTEPHPLEPFVVSAATGVGMRECLKGIEAMIWAPESVNPERFE